MVVRSAFFPSTLASAGDMVVFFLRFNPCAWKEETPQYLLGFLLCKCRQERDILYVCVFGGVLHQTIQLERSGQGFWIWIFFRVAVSTYGRCNTNVSVSVFFCSLPSTAGACVKLAWSPHFEVSDPVGG